MAHHRRRQDLVKQLIGNDGAARPVRTDLAVWLEARQALLPIAATTTTPSGRTLDWIAPQAQAPALATPPPSPAHSIPQDPARPTKTASFDVGEPGPAAHVPVLRPDLSQIPDRIGVDQLFSKAGGLTVNPNRIAPAAPEAAPAPPATGQGGYFHATTQETQTVYGCEAWLNVWPSKVDLPSSPGEDHSISQTWLQNYAAGPSHLHSVEAGLTVDPILNGDAAPHLFTYYTNSSYSPPQANGLGGYNQISTGWVQVHPTIYPGIRVLGASSAGGAQFELGIKFRLWQGNWWLAVEDSYTAWTWIGYYPGTLFPGGLVHGAGWIAFGGEVFSDLADPCTTKDQMGSGRKAATGYAHSAFQRLLHAQTNAAGTTAGFTGTAATDKPNANCAANEYTIAWHPGSGAAWGSCLFYGGPSN